MLCTRHVINGGVTLGNIQAPLMYSIWHGLALLKNYYVIADYGAYVLGKASFIVTNLGPRFVTISCQQWLPLLRN